MPPQPGSPRDLVKSPPASPALRGQPRPPTDPSPGLGARGPPRRIVASSPQARVSSWRLAVRGAWGRPWAWDASHRPPPDVEALGEDARLGEGTALEQSGRGDGTLGTATVVSKAVAAKCPRLAG